MGAIKNLLHDEVAFDAYERRRLLESAEHHRVTQLEVELADAKNDRDAFWDAYVDARAQLEEARAEIVSLHQQLQIQAMSEVES
jgi:hypothetical protein